MRQILKRIGFLLMLAVTFGLALYVYFLLLFGLTRT